MRQPLRTILLIIATLFMAFVAIISAIGSVPHLREDMEEIGVRPTLLRAVMLGLNFGVFAMFGITGVLLAATIQSLRSAAIPRLALTAIAITLLAFGGYAFAVTWSHHTLGYVLIGLLIVGSVLITERHKT
jgi:hypothetical protein